MDNQTLTGANLIGATASSLGTDTYAVSSRHDGVPLSPSFSIATKGEVALAAEKAAEAFPIYSRLSGTKRAEFLDLIANGIEGLGDSLLQRAHAESGLPLPRLTGERGRTCGQLRIFANLLREGSWVDARIDSADPKRVPPKPDLRRMLMPIGPVVVFGASNFPLAFSVAGGDTASALAAGCPVIVKAHPAHPGTSEMVGRVICEAVATLGLPEGTFSLVHGDAAVGRALVERSEIYAVGFTGSLAAGRALFNAAAARPRPIPVYAEMGSVNPLFVMEDALAARGAALAKGYADSLTLGVGQFCTNPGVVVGLAGAAFDSFLTEAALKLQEVSPGLMLTDAICARYEEGISRWFSHADVEPVSARSEVAGKAMPALVSVTGAAFLADSSLAEEVFGPGALAIKCSSPAEMIEVAATLEGQLTATVHFETADAFLTNELWPVLSRGAGRVIANGFPTGVEVNPSMQHGGPYPATTDSRSTSVGTAAIFRFVRPVAFQDAPEGLLPSELRGENPLGIWRLVDGVQTK